MFFVKFGERHLIDVTLYKNYYYSHDSLFATERATNEVRKFDLAWEEKEKDKAFTRFCECVMLLNTYKEDD